ncbi:TerB family tellurite resistance protein [Paraburkholderia sp. Tr-20389]|uniref:tellurite resistance TerB family protein n=1 Tax=Paraburkholderia sp. Tr-20389 TaxID=2703903 RepID=UPI00198238D1|nr:TerB family tellurite resistance protein [Paraburkholderia sp. Tr-20389]MBN3755526.1 TerB family tellurite resistance protein [Paraburkholderia sp. Tr-20389]
MRHYRSDSPEAAARIVAACLLSDGHVGIDELEALDRYGMEERLQMNRGQLLAVMQQMCEDLTTTAYLNWGDACRLDPAVVFGLAQDIKDWRLRREIIALCEEGAQADGHISDPEALFIRTLHAAWYMPGAREIYESPRSRERLTLARTPPG